MWLNEDISDVSYSNKVLGKRIVVKYNTARMTSFYIKYLNFSYSLHDPIEDEMKLVVTVNKFRCSTSSSGLSNEDYKTKN